METKQQQKAALRRRLAAREQAMTRRERELSDWAIIYHVTRTEEYRLARTVFAFVGCGREIGTRALLERILSEGKELCVPLCTGPGRMECRRLGRGGGYYDRFLARYTGSTLLLCRERLLCPDIPREAHDICIPAVITEKGRLWAAG